MELIKDVLTLLEKNAGFHIFLNANTKYPLNFRELY